MEENNKKSNLKNALCYIPLVVIVLAFTETEKTEEFKRHLHRGIFLFVLYLFVRVVLWIFFFYYSFVFWWLVTLIYFIISWVLFYKAYMGENIKIDPLDDFEEKVKDSLK